MAGGPFAIIPRQVLTNHEIGYQAICLYGILATYANSDLECWPSQETLAADLGVKDPRSVRYGVDALDRAGYIEREPRFNDAGMRNGTTYRLCIKVGKNENIRTGTKPSAGPEGKIPDGAEEELPDGPEGELPPGPEPELPLNKTRVNKTNKTPPRPAGSGPLGQGSLLDPPSGPEDEPPALEPDEVTPPARPTATKPELATDNTKGSRLPADWQLTPEMLAFGTDEGFSDEQVYRIADKFADHWHGQPGARGRKCNWTATWRNWIRTEAERRGPGPGSFPGHPNGHRGAGQNSVTTAVALALHARQQRAHRH
jgi:hypothetical protein